MIRSLTSERNHKGRTPGPSRAARAGANNLHFRVWSPAAQPYGYPDRIVLETGYTDKQAVARVADGRADLIFERECLSGFIKRLGDPVQLAAPQKAPGVHSEVPVPQHRNTPVRQRRCSPCCRLCSRPASAQRHVWPLGKLVTCQLIPPHFAAYQRYCPFTLPGGADGQWTAPDVNRANALVRKSGTRGAKVVGALVRTSRESGPAPSEPGTSSGDLGYRVSVRRLRNTPRICVRRIATVGTSGSWAGKPTTRPRRTYPRLHRRM